ncbi:hypothetical protein ABT114_50070, partial [Streptomyces sp. NPDC002088]
MDRTRQAPCGTPRSLPVLPTPGPTPPPYSPDGRHHPDQAQENLARQALLSTPNLVALRPASTVTTPDLVWHPLPAPHPRP